MFGGSVILYNNVTHSVPLAGPFYQVYIWGGFILIDNWTSGLKYSID